MVDTAKIFKYLSRVHSIKKLLICNFTVIPEDARFGFIALAWRHVWFWRNFVRP